MITVTSRLDWRTCFLLLVILNALDLIFAIIFMHFGGPQFERNPISRYLISHHWNEFYLFKIGVGTLALYGYYKFVFPKSRSSQSAGYFLLAIFTVVTAANAIHAYYALIAP